MQITVDTSVALTNAERSMLAALLGLQTEVEASRTVVTEPAVKSPAKPATRKPAAKPEVVEEPEDDDLLGEDEPAVTREQVVALVTKMAAGGEGKKVKAALVALKAGKVSELPDEKLQDLFDAISS